MVLIFFKATGAAKVIEEAKLAEFSVVLPKLGSATDENPEGNS